MRHLDLTGLTSGISVVAALSRMTQTKSEVTALPMGLEDDTQERQHTVEAMSISKSSLFGRPSRSGRPMALGNGSTDMAIKLQGMRQTIHW